MKSISFFLVLFLLVSGCKNEGSPKDQPAETKADSTTVKYKLTPFSPSKQFDDASIKAMAYIGGTFSTVISGTSYKLGEQTSDAAEKQCANSKEGQHLHLIIDNEPYIAKYESSFTQEIADGDHYLLCFLSRSYHESIKTAAAHRAALVTVKNKSITKSSEIQGPMLFYSRPKGLYTGDDIQKVMLDFYLINAEMPNYKVEANINGEKHLLDTWQPYYIEGLPEGDNSITLTLLDSTGMVAKVPLNPVTRTFKLEKTPAAQ
ncbi:MAG TPA: hypothetical protein VFV79_04785 [Saprospiraceae bacterium]|nr:hypothetical protein [Saprospiraceae bacterium]